ncbi:hypothetical protein GCM10010170_007420 [Dactylosporangium salmoneum]|uniref:Uncharacterized protein n=1 Tax=Dactylosporangium salmoneum TaxID=53361 RepID=A0ABN3FH82_9ACTN
MVLVGAPYDVLARAGADVGCVGAGAGELKGGYGAGRGAAQPVNCRKMLLKP